jgi:hypothetical protein
MVEGPFGKLRDRPFLEKRVVFGGGEWASGGG